MNQMIRQSVGLICRNYLWLAACISGLVAYLNYHATAMQGILPCYQDYKRIILAGFDPTVALHGTPAFPMWGYGWMYVLTENHLALLIIQIGLALLSVAILIRHIEQRELLGDRAVAAVKLLLLVSLPWYAFQTVRWPYSIAISLFMLSLVFLHRGVSGERFSVRQLVLSGALFGLALNFRSDYYLMPVGFVVAVCWCSRPVCRSFARMAVWAVTAYAMLTPWMLYTHHVTGHALLTSTNGGHVLFIGLGTLPENKWGITPCDEDPLMHELIREHFGEAKPSCGYEANSLLTREFRNRVVADPAEYARKCRYAAWSILRYGVYSGEFIKKTPDEPDATFNSELSEFIHAPLRYWRDCGVGGTARLLLQAVSKGMGMLLVILSYLFLPIMLFWAVVRRNVFWLLLTLAICYQTTLQIVASTMPCYTANLYFLHILNVTVGCCLVLRLASARALPGTGATRLPARD